MLLAYRAPVTAAVTDSFQPDTVIVMAVALGGKEVEKALRLMFGGGP